MLKWDEARRAANLAKHGVDFNELYQGDWNSSLIGEDERKDYGELRFCAFIVISFRLHVCIFTRRSETLRIISLRKANRREIEVYEVRVDPTF